MRKGSVSITICIIGLVDTENAITAVEEFRPGFSSKFPTIANPSETALNVIKGGAQRWKYVYYPYLDIFMFNHLYNIMPETIAALLRIVFS